MPDFPEELQEAVKKAGGTFLFVETRRNQPGELPGDTYTAFVAHGDALTLITCIETEEAPPKVGAVRVGVEALEHALAMWRE